MDHFKLQNNVADLYQNRIWLLWLQKMQRPTEKSLTDWTALKRKNQKDLNTPPSAKDELLVRKMSPVFERVGQNVK